MRFFHTELPRRRPGSRRVRPLRIEPLEARCLLTQFVVDTLVDESDGDFSAGDLSLREAIEQANDREGADTIRFDPALAGGTIVLSGTQLTVSDPAGTTIEGSSSLDLTINADRRSRVMATSGPARLTISWLTLSGGLTSTNGGGIQTLEGTVELTNVRVINNRSEGQGAGLSVGLDATLRLTNSLVAGNTSFANAAGIINSGSMTLINTAVRENRARGNGGGIFNFGVASEATLRDVAIFGNRVGVPNNDSGDSNGGGITNQGTMRLTNTTVSTNVAQGNGGGIVNQGALVIVQSTITNNRGDSDGDNAGVGGGVFTNPDVPASNTRLFNSIVSGNIRGSGTRDGNMAGRPPAGISEGNLVGSGMVFPDPSKNLVGINNPMLSLFGPQGGLTWGHIPLADSPVLDAGLNARAVDDDDVPLSFDQRGAGFPRILGGRVDIGALEGTSTGFVTVQPDGDLLVLGTEGVDVFLVTSPDPSEVLIARDGVLAGPYVLANDNTIEVRGFEGDDVIDAVGVGRVDLIVEGGPGADLIRTGQGRDLLLGESGDDTLNGGGGTDTLEGGTGNDTLRGAGNNDTLRGGSGDDDLDGNNLDDLVDGGPGNDLIAGGRRDDELIGGPGNDTLIGRGGEDFLNGGLDDDQLFGGGGEDTLLGDSGDDTLIGQNGADTIRGDAGNDSLDGGPGGDLLEGGSNRDTLRGGQQTDSLFGGDGVDLFVVGAIPGSGPFSDEHELRMANGGFLQHRQFRNGVLIDQDRIFNIDPIFDEVLLEALGGDDTLRVASDVMIGGTLNGGDGFDVAILDPTIRANWILASIEREDDSDD